LKEYLSETIRFIRNVSLHTLQKDAEYASDGHSRIRVGRRLWSKHTLCQSHKCNKSVMISSQSNDAKFYELFFVISQLLLSMQYKDTQTCCQRQNNEHCNNNNGRLQKRSDSVPRL